MNLSTLLRVACTAALLAVTPAGWGAFDPVNDDTDIFLANPSFDATRPNILIFVDNTANWGQAADGASKFTHEKSALISVISSLSDAHNVGLAMFTETGGDNSGDPGGFIRYAVRQMTPTNKDRLVNLISALDESGDRANAARWSNGMREMYQYHAGVTSFAGFNKTKRDYAGNTTNNPFAADLPRNAFTTSASSTYVSPITDACQKNFIIFISNGEPSENSSSLAQAEAYLSSIGGSTSTIALSPTGQEGNWADEYANFMANSDCSAQFDGVQNVYTYTVDVVPGTSGQGPATTALLKSMAGKGKGKYFAVSGSNTAVELTNALNAIFNEVQAVNSVFASSTLPVSVNVRGTNLNQVYIGVFRPDANKNPRWLGNLKLYKLGVNTATETLFLADANGDAAENSSTGFITGSALSFWTQASTYWGFRDPELNGVGGASDAPDGDLVEKGGAAQQLRLAFPSDQSARKLYTCLSNDGTGLCTDQPALTSAQNAFDSGNARITAADLGAFVSYDVGSLTSNGTTATLVLGATPSPSWAVGDQIRVSGATPAEYDGIYALTGADNATMTYTYTLASEPDASAVLATGTDHGLQTGDLVTVNGTVALDAADAVVTRVDANSFRYSRLGADGTHGAITVTGKKTVTSLTGSGFAATAVVAGHGFASGNTITINGANETAFNKTATITVVDGDSFTYSTSPDVISGAADTAKATAAAHNLDTGQANVFVTGNTVAAYNGGPKTVTRIDNNSVTFASTEVLMGAGGVIGVRVTNFTHPTTGGPARDVLTVTTDGEHKITSTDAFPFSVTIVGGTNEGAGRDFSIYNGTWQIAAFADVISSTQFRITDATFDSGGIGNPATTVISGKPITSIGPIVSATGTIRAAKDVNLGGLTALTRASGAITAGRLVDSDATERTEIIAWTRGADNKDNENPVTGPAGSDIRPSVHGDVLHSRPAVVNYNRYGDDNDIYAFYGGNDGVFRALKGGTENHASGPDAGLAPGSERWGFVPREFFGRLQRLRNQAPAVSAAAPKDYFADGSIGIYQKDVPGTGDVALPGDGTVTGVIGDNSGDKVYLYMSLRRGGDFLYALDVTNPASPKLLWRKGFGDPGWELLGQTWSEPKIAKVQTSLGNPANPENVVLIIGAGYDRDVEDLNPCLLQDLSTSGIVIKPIGSGSVTHNADGTCTISGATGTTSSVDRARGAGVLVVDAFNGNVVWQSGAALTTAATAFAKKLHVPGMSCAIPSDVTVLDKNRDGFADRLYAGDTCGQVWRVDIAGGDMDEWTVTQIAALSSGGTTDIANKRKFLFPPDLVFGTDASNYTAVLLGSGDREHPFETIVLNAFYMLKDRDSADPGNPQAGATNSTSVKISGFGTPPTGDVITHLNPGTTGVFDATNTEGANDRGWKIHLGSGEKVVSSATTISGTTFFNTNQPSATAGGGSCGSNLGIAREYLVGFADASATVDLNASDSITIADRSTIHAGGGYLPSPVPVVVEIDGKRYQAVISGTSVQSPPGLTLERRTRTYWYKEVD
ncbi:MAG: hypothetical protein WD775_05400 [Burkholderiales bacterium]